jgi:cytochrome c-type biogenesis protein
VGPTLAAINVLSVNEATAARGAVLSAVYALGLGLPFILAAVAYRRMIGAFAVVRRHQVLVTRVGGVMMIVVGILLVTGWWDVIVQWLQLQVVQGFETSL